MKSIRYEARRKERGRRIWNTATEILRTRNDVAYDFNPLLHVFTVVVRGGEAGGVYSVERINIDRVGVALGGGTVAEALHPAGFAE